MSNPTNVSKSEDSTRIGSAGTVRRQAVDVSPLRRVNQAIALLTIGAREAAFRNVKSIAEVLAYVAFLCSLLRKLLTLI